MLFPIYCYISIILRIVAYISLLIFPLCYITSRLYFVFFSSNDNNFRILSITFACYIHIVLGGWMNGFSCCSLYYIQLYVSVILVDKFSILSLSPPEMFSIDHPFVYLIVKKDRNSKNLNVITLFNGLIYNL